MDIQYFNQINRQYLRLPDTDRHYRNELTQLDRLRPQLAVKGGGPEALSQITTGFDPPIFKETLLQLLKENQAPTMADVKQGKVMHLGQEGPAVTELKQTLKGLGYPLNESAYFDRDTAFYLGKFQKENQVVGSDSPYLGKLGPSTLSALKQKSVWGDYDAKMGKNLAHFASRHRSGGRSRCYYYVAKAIHAHTKPFLEGYHAYMAADHLAQNDQFKEVKIPAQKLDTLPAGAVVVWDRGRSRSGHISIADGQGHEISDHRSRQMLAHYGGGSHRVFIPVLAKA